MDPVQLPFALDFWTYWPETSSYVAPSLGALLVAFGGKTTANESASIVATSDASKNSVRSVALAWSPIIRAIANLVTSLLFRVFFCFTRHAHEYPDLLLCYVHSLPPFFFFPTFFRFGCFPCYLFFLWGLSFPPEAGGRPCQQSRFVVWSLWPDVRSFDLRIPVLLYRLYKKNIIRSMQWQTTKIAAEELSVVEQIKSGPDGRGSREE